MSDGAVQQAVSMVQKLHNGVIKEIGAIMNEENPKLVFEVCKLKNSEAAGVLLDSIAYFVDGCVYCGAQKCHFNKVNYVFHECDAR